MKDPFKVVNDAMAAALDDAHEDAAVDDADPRSLADAPVGDHKRRGRHGKNAGRRHHREAGTGDHPDAAATD